jgi:hypothetical protein
VQAIEQQLAAYQQAQVLAVGERHVQVHIEVCAAFPEIPWSPTAPSASRDGPLHC